MSDPRFITRQVQLKELYRYKNYSLVELPGGEYDIVHQNGNSTGMDTGGIAFVRMTALVAVKMAAEMALKLTKIERAPREVVEPK
ncbi:MAG: hypothetical protein ACK5XS_10060 [Armatimonadota bacterium]|nr:hypothetical protein [Fimbriimonadaceae bacterium]MCZ8139215.1 hypothetical protein [Fimbriimonadaceae bacterium]